MIFGQLNFGFCSWISASRCARTCTGWAMVRKREVFIFVQFRFLSSNLSCRLLGACDALGYKMLIPIHILLASCSNILLYGNLLQALFMFQSKNKKVFNGNINSGNANRDALVDCDTKQRFNYDRLMDADYKQALPFCPPTSSLATMSTRQSCIVFLDALCMSKKVLTCYHIHNDYNPFYFYNSDHSYLPDHMKFLVVSHRIIISFLF